MTFKTLLSNLVALVLCWFLKINILINNPETINTIKGNVALTFLKNEVLLSSKLIKKEVKKKMNIQISNIMLLMTKFPLKYLITPIKTIKNKNRIKRTTIG